jgi:zinc protease
VSVPSAPDRTQPPPPGPPRGFRFPDFERYRLANGLEVLLGIRAGVPLAEATLLLPAGGDRGPLEHPGLAALAASLLDEGTESRGGPEIAATVERLGGSLGSSADWTVARISVQTLADDLPTGLELVAEIARQPAFADHEVERLRQQTATELLRRRDQPAALAEEALVRTLYRGTVYGEILLGTEASVARLTRDQLAGFYRRHATPAGAALVIAGDIDAGAARAEVERRFGDWRGSEAQPPPEIAPAPAVARRVVIVDRPGASQTEMRIGQVGVPRTHPDRSRLSLLNCLLGGKFTSRINLNLREKHGFTYGASTRFVDRRGPGPFVLGAAVATESVGAAVAESLAELERLLAEPIPDAELDDARTYLTGVFPYTLQTVEGLAGRLEEIATFGLPSDYYERIFADYARFDSAEIGAAARRHLHPATAVIVAVGPADLLAPQLERFGTIERLDP